MPTPSPEVTEHTVHGAEAAASSYLIALDYVFATGDASPILAMSTPECISCEGQISSIRKVYAAGGHYSSRKTEIRASISTTPQPQSPTIVIVAYLGSPMISYLSNDRPQATYQSDEESQLKFALKFIDGRWLVDEYTSPEVELPPR